MYLCGCSLFLDGGAGCNFLACLHACSSQHRPSVLLRSSIDGPQVAHRHEHWFIQTQIISISQCTAESCEKRSPSRDPQAPRESSITNLQILLAGVIYTYIYILYIFCTLGTFSLSLLPSITSSGLPLLL